VTVDVIGWASSAVLLVTLADQTAKMYRSDSTRGVSRWLFVGQLLASAGFTIYSAFLHNIVFTVTNSLGFLTAACGLWIVWRKRRAARIGDQRGARIDRIDRVDHIGGAGGKPASWPRLAARPFSRAPRIH
jgi:MtN3 and saliva related transmembrane protein